MVWDRRYRQLSEGEVIEAGDEVLCDDDRGWELASERTIGTLAPDPLCMAHRMYRRLRSERDR